MKLGANTWVGGGLVGLALGVAIFAPWIALTDPVMARASLLRWVCPTTRTAASRAASTSTRPPYPWTTEGEMGGVWSIPCRARATALSWTAVARSCASSSTGAE